MSFFSGATDTPVLDFGFCNPGLQSQDGSLRLHALLPAPNGFLRFTSGATPADLLATSMAANPLYLLTVSSTDGGPTRVKVYCYLWLGFSDG